MKTFEYKHNFVFDEQNVEQLHNILNKINYEDKKLIYDSNYKEPIFNFKNSKNLSIIDMYPPLNNSKMTYTFGRFTKSFDLIHEYDYTYEESILEYILIEIVKPAINDYLNRTLFLDSFYYNFVETFIEKMVSTVKNYTIESGSYESVIPPFDTGWIEFCSSDSFDDIIDELTLICLNKMFKDKVILNDVTLCNRKSNIKCSLYDVLMKGDLVLQKLFSNTTITFFATNYSEISYNQLSKNFVQINDTTKNFDYKNYIDGYGKETIDNLKKCVRYIFIELFRQSIPYYLMKKSKNDKKLKFLISDIELYYTRNLITLKNNHDFYTEKLSKCFSMINEYEKIADGVKHSYSKDLNNIIGLIFSHVTDQESKIKLNDMLHSFNDDKIYSIDEFKSVYSIIEVEDKKLSKIIDNSYNFSFIKRWKEIIKENTIWIPEDYIDSKMIFLKETY